MNGQEINERLAKQQCLDCLKALQPVYDTDPQTGFIGPRCAPCRAAAKHRSVRRSTFDAKAELEAGIENLRKLGA